MRIRLVILACSLTSVVLGLVWNMVMFRETGASNAWAAYTLLLAFLGVLSGLTGVSDGRHQMIHERLSREGSDAERIVRQVFASLLLMRLALGAFLVSAPLSWLEFVTGLSHETLMAGGEWLPRLIGLEFLAQIFVEVGFFAAVTRGWLFSHALFQATINLSKLLGLLLLPWAIEGSIAGMVAGQVLLGLVFMVWRLRKRDLRCFNPLISPKEIALGFKRLIPTALLGAFPLVVYWLRSLSLGDAAGLERTFGVLEDGPRLLGLFNYVSPLLLSLGMLISILVTSTYGVRASDSRLEHDERKRLAAAGLMEGLGWTFGLALMVAAGAPWIIRVLYGHGSAMQGDEVETMSHMLVWMSPLVSGAALYSYSVRIALALEYRRLLIVVGMIVLLATACSFFVLRWWGVTHHESIVETPISSLAGLTTALASLIASGLFFVLKFKGAGLRAEAATRAWRSLLGGGMACALVVAGRTWLMPLSDGSRLVDMAALGSCFALAFAAIAGFELKGRKNHTMRAASERTRRISVRTDVIRKSDVVKRSDS